MRKDRCYRDLSEEEQNQLWETFAQGDENSRELLIQLNEPLVRAVVSASSIHSSSDTEARAAAALADPSQAAISFHFRR